MGLDNPLHIAFLLIIVLMVFGAKRLPEMGRSLGSGLRGFKDSLNPEASPPRIPSIGDREALAPEHPDQEHTAA
jgi:sec-independent protein translocase protein TatA